MCLFRLLVSGIRHGLHVTRGTWHTYWTVYPFIVDKMKSCVSIPQGVAVSFKYDMLKSWALFRRNFYKEARKQDTAGPHQWVIVSRIISFIGWPF